jgi:hypothetical protein
MTYLSEQQEMATQCLGFTNKGFGSRCIKKVETKPGEPAFCANHDPVTHPECAAHREAIQCQGETDDGKQCTRMLKNGSVHCHQHSPDRVVKAKKGKAADVPTHLCAGETKAGNPCKNKLTGDREYCGYHDPDREVKTPGPKKGSKKASKKDDREPCQEFKKDGEPCTNKAKEGSDYCGNHDPDRVTKAASTKTKKTSDRPQCEGTTGTGKQCSRLAKDGSHLCGIHEKMAEKKMATSADESETEEESTVSEFDGFVDESEDGSEETGEDGSEEDGEEEAGEDDEGEGEYESSE